MILHIAAKFSFAVDHCQILVNVVLASLFAADV